MSGVDAEDGKSRRSYLCRRPEEGAVATYAEDDVGTVLVVSYEHTVVGDALTHLFHKLRFSVWIGYDGHGLYFRHSL